MIKRKLIIGTSLDVIMTDNETLIDILICSPAKILLENVLVFKEKVLPIFFSYKEFSESIDFWWDNHEKFLEKLVPCSKKLHEDYIILIVVHPYCVDDLFEMLEDINNLYQKFEIIDFDEIEEDQEEDTIDKGEIFFMVIENEEKIVEIPLSSN